MADPSVLELALLFAAGLTAGAVNTVAGAGSLLLLPALIWAGLPADAANATNRVSILSQSTMAVLGFHRAGYRVRPVERTMLGLVMIGAVGGSSIATRLSADAMELAIVITMVVMLVVALLPARKPQPDPSAPKDGAPRDAPAASLAGPSDETARRLKPIVALGLLGVGVYGGFLQAGVGIVLLLFLSHATDIGVLRANVLKSYAALALTISALVVFVWAGEWIDLTRGLAVAAGSGIGGLVGVRATVRLGAVFVQRAVTAALTAALLKMLYDLVVS